MTSSSVKNKRFCFVCLEPLDLHYFLTEELPTTHNIPVQLYLKFISLISRYLQVPGESVENSGNVRKCDAFCSTCVVRLKNIFTLYSELCEVEQRLCARLEQLGERMTQANNGKNWGLVTLDALAHTLGSHLEVLRNLVATKCLQKCDEIRAQASLYGTESSEQFANEGNENKGELEISNENDDDGAEFKEEVESFLDSLAKQLGAEMNSTEPEGVKEGGADDQKTDTEDDEGGNRKSTNETETAQVAFDINDDSDKEEKKQISTDYDESEEKAGDSCSEPTSSSGLKREMNMKTSSKHQHLDDEDGHLEKSKQFGKREGPLPLKRRFSVNETDSESLSKTFRI